MAGPADGAAYTGVASVTLRRMPTRLINPDRKVDFYANGSLLGTLTNSLTAPLYTMTATGLTAGSYAINRGGYAMEAA